MSAFGFSGTNAHIIVQDDQVSLPSSEDQKGIENAPGPYLLPLSAKNTAALGRYAADYANYLETHTDYRTGDVCFTAAAIMPYLLF